MSCPRIGILAIQGGFAEHADAVLASGGDARLVRSRRDGDNIDALIVPGGESTVIARAVENQHLRPWLDELYAANLPMLATCAGAILFSKAEISENYAGFGYVPAVLMRNGYGRQNESFVEQVTCRLDPSQPKTQSAVFIRAPRIHHYDEVEVIAERPNHEVVGLRYRSIVLLTFHPELTDNRDYHRYLCSKAGGH